VIRVLFAVLLAFTSRWTVFEAKSLQDNSHNQRARLQQQRIHRGVIRADDGTVIARSRRQAGGVWTRTYPRGDLFAHAVGYSYTTLGRSGLERSRNHALIGADDGITSLVDQLRGKQQAGRDVVTTLNVEAQGTAMRALAGRKGSVVALDPRTGAVKVMASAPSFDPAALRSRKTYAALNGDEQGRPLVNRATQFGYAPGSTFKVVTAAAAIDSGRFTPHSIVDGSNGVKISGVPLQNDYGQGFGRIDLTTALAESVNTAYAQVAEKVGKDTLGTYMERFGFDAKPQLDYPTEQMSSSGEFRKGALLKPTSRFVDVGRMGIGHDKLSVTPLQMAEVAATVANGGRLMRPHLTDRIVDVDGRTVEKVQPSVQSTVMKPQTATALTSMMEAVVQRGTGTAAQIPGVRVAGKTGTAETQLGRRINDVWFIAFAPADRPRVAIAVTLAGQTGFGGAIAAPIAKQVMEALLR
jgi:peptidoglycan glycosyltransferase